MTVQKYTHWSEEEEELLLKLLKDGPHAAGFLLLT